MHGTSGSISVGLLWVGCLVITYVLTCCVVCVTLGGVMDMANKGTWNKYEPKRDCQMYVSDKVCGGLKQMYCLKEKKCVFYKPKE